MDKVKYIISRDDIENTPKMFMYSKLEPYHTVRIDENGSETFNGDVSEYMVKNGIDGIPSSEADDWIYAVETFINDHNDKVDANKGFDIKFNISSIDSRYAYAYEEIVNGELVKSGVGWGLDFETQAETDAWIDAVIKYNTEHGIKMPTDKIREKIDKIKETIKLLDSELPELKEFSLPTISVALPTFDNDPCEFVSKIKEAAENAVATIAGMPSIKDIINYNIKVLKENVYITTSRLIDSQTEIVTQYFDGVGDVFEDTTKYWAEVDAYYHQILKAENEAEYFFDTVLEPPIKVDPIVLSYNGAEGADNDNGAYLPTGDIPTVNISDTDRAIEYKEVSYLNIYSSGATSGTPQENYMAKQHVGEAMRNLWVPLRKAWEQYAINTLHIDPTWRISSGYRPPTRNKKAGGSLTSAHLYGYAIDVQLLSFRSPEQKRLAVRYLGGFLKAFFEKNKNIYFDQLIIEGEGSSLSTASTCWVHIGYKNMNGLTRREYFAWFNKSSGKHSKIVPL